MTSLETTMTGAKPTMTSLEPTMTGAKTDYDNFALPNTHLTLLEYLAGGNKTREEIQLRLKLRSPSHLRTGYLSPLLNAGLIELTIPEKPKSKNQQYRLTFAGKQLLAREQ